VSSFGGEVEQLITISTTCKMRKLFEITEEEESRGRKKKNKEEGTKKE